MIDLKKEIEYLKRYVSILGLDEAGRGPWAGPMVVAGILLKNPIILIDKIDDSKKISEKKREELYNQIIRTYKYKIVVIDNLVIDEKGVGKAGTDAMLEIIDFFKSDLNLVDGYFRKDIFPKNTECVIDGDAKHYSIAAASILAKHTRDQLMIDLDKVYPKYNFKKHKGYGTKEHMELLKLHGVSPIHRISYKPIKQYL